MGLVDDVFGMSNVNFDKLESYGFKRYDGKYVYEVEFLEGFKAIVNVDSDGIVDSKVIDLSINEEYININTSMSGIFVNKVRKLYKDILLDIRDNCFLNCYFVFDQTNRINEYIFNKYGSNPCFLWDKFPRYGVYKNKYNKWFAIIMNIDRSKLGYGSGEVEIINVKLDRDKVNKLIDNKCFYEAYHMNKLDWISIVLDDSLSDQYIFSLIDESYCLVDK